MKAKDFLTAGVICLLVLVSVMVTIILTSDCDLILWAMEHFGKAPDSLSGQVVWITGASRGIGEELAYVLAAAGSKLVLSARRQQELQHVKQQCVDVHKAKEKDVMVLPLDQTQYDSHQDAVRTCSLTSLRSGRIDILVNNAGRSQRALWLKTSLTVDRQMLELNTLGPLSLSKAVLPHMVTRKSGHIVIMSSMAGLMGVVGVASYVGSKHALHGWFDTLRMEVYDDNIRATMLCPGPILSDIRKNAFTGNPGEKLGVGMKPSENRMSTKRCAHLCAVAIANQLDEVWISLQPELSYYYVNQYLPSVARWVRNKSSAKRLQKLKAGDHNLH